MTPEDTHEDFQLKGVYTAALTPLTADLGAEMMVGEARSDGANKVFVGAVEPARIADAIHWFD